MRDNDQKQDRKDETVQETIQRTGREQKRKEPFSFLGLALLAAAVVLFFTGRQLPGGVVMVVGFLFVFHGLGGHMQAEAEVESAIVRDLAPELLGQVFEDPSIEQGGTDFADEFEARTLGLFPCTWFIRKNVIHANRNGFPFILSDVELGTRESKTEDGTVSEYSVTQFRGCWLMFKTDSVRKNDALINSRRGKRPPLLKIGKKYAYTGDAEFTKHFSLRLENGPPDAESLSPATVEKILRLKELLPKYCFLHLAFLRDGRRVAALEMPGGLFYSTTLGRGTEEEVERYRRTILERLTMIASVMDILRNG